MLSHIRDLEKLLGENGVEVKPWEWAPYDQHPPGISFDSAGNPVSDSNGDTWSQIGSTWVKDSSATPRTKPGFPRSLLESRPEDAHLGVAGDSAPLSSIKGTQLSILGMTVDLASFEAPDMDEPPPDGQLPTPLYNKSSQAFLQSIMNVNPPVEPRMPTRHDVFTYVDYYFLALSPFLPILHKPTFMPIVSFQLFPSYTPPILTRATVDTHV